MLFAEADVVAWLRVIGLGGTLLVLIAIPIGNHRRRIASLQECPDCLEYVKARARVCRYCGYRFAPPPEPE